jgi:hypothetical protein
MAETCSAAAALAPCRILATAGGMTDVGRPWNKSCFESRVPEAIFQSGHPEAGIFPISLTRNLDLEGTGVPDLARRAGMTKQAMGELLRQCGASNLVVKREDSPDQRARAGSHPRGCDGSKGAGSPSTERNVRRGTRSEQCRRMGPRPLSRFTMTRRRHADPSRRADHGTMRRHWRRPCSRDSGPRRR